MKDFKTNGIKNKRTVLLKNMRKNAVRKEKRRNRFRRFLGRAAVVCLVLSAVGVMGFGGYTLLTSPLFVVQKIVLEGDAHLNEKSLRSYEERLAANIFRVDLQAARRDLLQEPYVKNVFLRRELPNRIYIYVEERVPFVLLKMDRMSFLVDSEGRILEEVKEGPAPSLPVISGLHRDNQGLWKETLSHALTLVETMTNYGYPELKELKEIRMTKDHGAVLHPVVGGFEIRCGTGDFFHKMILLKKVASDLAKRKRSIEHIDLRFRDQVVIGTKRTV